VSLRFEELDWQPTAMGDLSLRRRVLPGSDTEVYEVKLGEEFLMSSLFTVAEIALADLGLAPLAALDRDGWDVVVGGLGLGYTARAVLADQRVRSLAVVEALGEVIGWQERGLLPLSAALTDDPRCRLVKGDFFALTTAENGYGAGVPDRLHAILVDIDHTPLHVLHPSHTPFYTADGLRRLAGRLHPGGVFALWSDDPPDDHFVSVLDQVFATTQAVVVPFANPLTGGESANSVYVSTVALA
jgi:spermidine synthase